MATPEIEAHLLRHVQSVGNAEHQHLIGGRSNHLDITASGIAEGIALGRYFRELGIRPDFVDTSPALRTQRTSKLVLKEMGLLIEPTLDDDLQELDQGDWEGRLRNEIYTPETLARISVEGKDFRAPNGESTNMTGLRMFEYLERRFEPLIANPPLVVFVFTHGYATRALASYLHDWTQEETYQSQTPNGSDSLFIRQDGQWSLRYLGRTPEQITQ